MSNDSPVANPSNALEGQRVIWSAENCLFNRGDGIHVDPAVLGKTLLIAINEVFVSNTYLVGLDYSALMKLLYDVGPDFPPVKVGASLVRLAADIAVFEPERQALYRAVKINQGEAEYYFEPVYLTDPDNPDDAGTLAQLNFDEFVADLWNKGIRFGIDERGVRAALASEKSERVIVARRLDVTPGKDATIIEVSDDIRRSDAPRQLPNGKLDLMAFQNRFPQIKKGERLLKKIPRMDGMLGFEMSGMPVEPPIPKDIDLGAMAGVGTAIDINAEGEFLVSLHQGFLNVDNKTGQLSVGDKIVSRDGVSSRTTGNLQLQGDYEEFGEVQEKRVIEGLSITVHADVFGNIMSRGGLILLNNNLVGGTAHNAMGDIRVKGMASGAVLQTNDGEIEMVRAEGCVISGARVMIDHASNCEIIADEVHINVAEGCAIAARKIFIESVGPRKQSEMLLYVLLPDSAKIDSAIEEMTNRLGELEATVEKHQQEMDVLTDMPEVSKYLMLASKVRKKELVLTPEQAIALQKMALAVAPEFKAMTKISQELKDAETAREAGLARAAQLLQQKKNSGGAGQVDVRMVTGDTLVRIMKFNPENKNVYDMPPKDIKTKLRGSAAGGEVIFSDCSGSFDWDFNQQSKV